MTLDERTANEWLDACRLLIADTVPELDGELYLVDAGSVPYRSPGCVFGFAMAADCVLGDWHGAIPNFDGPRPLIAMDLEAIAANTSGDRIQGALNVCLHEVAHVLPVQPPVEPLPGFVSANARATFAAEIASLAIERPQTDSQHDEDHDAMFCRRAMHLYSRARLAGWEVFLPGLLTGPAEHHESHLLAALAPEIAAMGDASFSTIEATDPPPAFMAAWDAAAEVTREFNQRLRTMAAARVTRESAGNRNATTEASNANET